LDTTRKLLYVAGDEKVFELPFESSADFAQAGAQAADLSQSPAN
jgi:hypothetical protein